MLTRHIGRDRDISLEDLMMAKRATRSLPEKTRDLASAAGGAIGQAALNVTHRAVNRARAAVALADHAIHGSPKKKAAAKKKRARAATTSLRKMPRKAARSAAAMARSKKARRAK
jgi:hypothetical protein